MKGFFYAAVEEYKPLIHSLKIIIVIEKVSETYKTLYETSRDNWYWPCIMEN